MAGLRQGEGRTLRCLQVFLDTWLPFFLAEARHAAAFLLLYAPAPATEKAALAPAQPPSPTATSAQQPGSARAAAAKAAAEAAAAKAAEVGCTFFESCLHVEVAQHYHEELPLLSLPSMILTSCVRCSLRKAHAKCLGKLEALAPPITCRETQAAPQQHLRNSPAPLMHHRFPDQKQMHQGSLPALQEAEEELSPIEASAAAQAAAEEAGMLLPEGPAVIAALVVGIHTDFQALVRQCGPRAVICCEMHDMAEQQPA